MNFRRMQSTLQEKASKEAHGEGFYPKRVHLSQSRTARTVRRSVTSNRTSARGPIGFYSVCMLFIACAIPFGIAPAANSSATQVARISHTQNPVEPVRVDVSLVLLEATVWDNAAKTMDALSDNEFVLLDNGVPQPIAYFSRDSIPLAVVLVVDTSGSMERIMYRLRGAAAAALKQLKPEDRVALFAFDSSTKLVVPLTRDKNKVANKIHQFTAQGGTRLQNAVIEAASYLREQAPRERRVIILISDDVISFAATRPTAEDVLYFLQSANAALYSIKVENRAENIPEEHWFIPKLAGIVAQTGGVVVEVRNAKGFIEAFESLISLLKSRYTLGFYPTEVAGDTSFHKLDLRLAPSFGEKGKDYKILSKDGYYASPPH
jgi:VWFA-related protein